MRVWRQACVMYACVVQRVAGPGSACLRVWHSACWQAAASWAGSSGSSGEQYRYRPGQYRPPPTARAASSASPSAAGAHPPAAAAESCRRCRPTPRRRRRRRCRRAPARGSRGGLRGAGRGECAGRRSTTAACWRRQPPLGGGDSDDHRRSSAGTLPATAGWPAGWQQRCRGRRSGPAGSRPGTARQRGRREPVPRPAAGCCPHT